MKEQFNNRNYKISLHPVIEYSLELPYGRQARIWVTTETACYRIMSVSANYTSFWQPFYEMVCFAGHVVNILLNYSGPIMMVKLIGQVSKLSGINPEETYDLFKKHRKFILDLLKDQNLSAKIRKEYNALQSNQANWELSWQEHLDAFEKKPEKKEKMNILSFFRSKPADENVAASLNSSSSTSLAESSKKSSTSFDDTSSLLSISEDESATYIEFPYETLEEIESEKLNEINMQNYIGSSFTSSGFLEWKLPENESLNESYYNCPLCKITFKTDEKDCISAFSVHLRAHRADCESNLETKVESILDLDFESRFSSFREDLQKLISGKVSCSPIPLKFEKKITEFSAEITERPFAQYSVLESEEIVATPVVINPIRVLKFTANVSTSPVPRPPPSVVAVPAPKKPRAKKPPAPKPTATTATIGLDSASSSSAYVTPLASPSRVSATSAMLSQQTMPSGSYHNATPFSPNQNQITVGSSQHPITVVSSQPTMSAGYSVGSNQVPTISGVSINRSASTIANLINTSDHPIAKNLNPAAVQNVPQISPPLNLIDSTQQGNPVNVNNPVFTPSVVLSAVMTASSFPVQKPQSPLNATPSTISGQTSPNSSKYASPIKSTTSSPRADPKSIIILDRETSYEPKSKLELQFSPQNYKRPSSAVPVPIEIFSTEDAVVTPPVPGVSDMVMTYNVDGKQLGCSHYKVNCKFYAECCGKWFTCRFCHDNASDHKLNRHETRFCLCMYCGTSQESSGRCSNPKCKSLLACYFCESCKFWDNDPNKLIYHCEKCGICRTGLKSNYIHCDRCEKCVSKSIIDGHNCQPAEVQKIQFSKVNSADTSEKRPKLELTSETVTNNPVNPVPKQVLTETKLCESSAPSNVKSSVDQTNYVNYLKNSLAYWRNKGPSATSATTTTETSQRRNCWNCMNALPSSPEGSINGKYCLHCSAIIE